MFRWGSSKRDPSPDERRSKKSTSSRSSRRSEGAASSSGRRRSRKEDRDSSSRALAGSRASNAPASDSESGSDDEPSPSTSRRKSTRDSPHATRSNDPRSVASEDAKSRRSDKTRSDDTRAPREDGPQKSSRSGQTRDDDIRSSRIDEGSSQRTQKSSRDDRDESEKASGSRSERRSSKQKSRSTDESRAGEGQAASGQQQSSQSNRIPNQFPDQTPLNYASSALPGQATFGAAADYYGDEGQSVAHQPGVRPGTPIIVGAEPHLQPASAEPAPPQETGHGAAAEFYNAPATAQTTQYSSAPASSGKPPKASLGASAAALTGRPPSSSTTQSYSTNTSRPPNSSSRPSKTSTAAMAAGAAGAVGLAATALSANGSHKTSHSHSLQGSATYSAGASATHQAGRPSRPSPQVLQSNSVAGGYSSSHQHSHHSQTVHSHVHARSPGPLNKLASWWNDYEDVAKMEAYTEYIGVCKHCFDPHSSPADAPRPHVPRRVRSRESIDSIRVDKERRYRTTESSKRRQRRDASWLGAGLAGIGLAQAARAIDGGSSDSSTSSGRASPEIPESSRPRRQQQMSASNGRTSQSYSERPLQSSTPTQAVPAGRAATQTRPGFSVDRPSERTSVHADSRLVGEQAGGRKTFINNRADSPPSEDDQQDVGFFGRMFGTPNRTPRRRPSRPGALYSQSNSSSSSVDSTLAFGPGRRRPASSNKPAGRKRRSSDEAARNALLGLGTAAAALAAHEARNNRRGHDRNERPYPGQIRLGKQRPTRNQPQHGPTYSGSDEEAWESATDGSSSASEHHGLAFGDEEGIVLTDLEAEHGSDSDHDPDAIPHRRDTQSASYQRPVEKPSPPAVPKIMRSSRPQEINAPQSVTPVSPERLKRLGWQQDFDLNSPSSTKGDGVPSKVGLSRSQTFPLSGHQPTTPSQTSRRRMQVSDSSESESSDVDARATRRPQDEPKPSRPTKSRSKEDSKNVSFAEGVAGVAGAMALASAVRSSRREEKTAPRREEDTSRRREEETSRRREEETSRRREEETSRRREEETPRRREEETPRRREEEAPRRREEEAPRRREEETSPPEVFKTQIRRPRTSTQDEVVTTSSGHTVTPPESASFNQADSVANSRDVWSEPSSRLGPSKKTENVPRIVEPSRSPSPDHFVMKIDQSLIHPEDSKIFYMTPPPPQPVQQRKSAKATDRFTTDTADVGPDHEKSDSLARDESDTFASARENGSASRDSFATEVRRPRVPVEVSSPQGDVASPPESGPESGPPTAVREGFPDTVPYFPPAKSRTSHPVADDNPLQPVANEKGPEASEAPRSWQKSTIPGSFDSSDPDTTKTSPKRFSRDSHERDSYIETLDDTKASRNSYKDDSDEHGEPPQQSRDAAPSGPATSGQSFSFASAVLGAMGKGKSRAADKDKTRQDFPEVDSKTPATAGVPDRNVASGRRIELLDSADDSSLERPGKTSPKPPIASPEADSPARETNTKDQKSSNSKSKAAKKKGLGFADIVPPSSITSKPKRSKASPESPAETTPVEARQGFADVVTEASGPAESARKEDPPLRKDLEKPASNRAASGFADVVSQVQKPVNGDLKSGTDQPSLGHSDLTIPDSVQPVPAHSADRSSGGDSRSASRRDASSIPVSGLDGDQDHGLPLVRDGDGEGWPSLRERDSEGLNHRDEMATGEDPVEIPLPASPPSPRTGGSHSDISDPNGQIYSDFRRDVSDQGKAPLNDSSPPSRGPRPTRAPSSTSVPLRFRNPRFSVGPSRESPVQSPVANDSPPATTPVRPRSARPSSTEFKKFKDFRPLYLVERNRKLSEPEESYPSLPSSRSTSRSSSIQDSEEAYESALEEPGSEGRSSDLDTASHRGVDVPLETDDLLDSGQTTPKAATDSPSQRNDGFSYSDLGKHAGSPPADASMPQDRALSSEPGPEVLSEVLPLTSEEGAKQGVGWRPKSEGDRTTGLTSFNQSQNFLPLGERGEHLNSSEASTELGPARILRTRDIPSNTDDTALPDGEIQYLARDTPLPDSDDGPALREPLASDDSVAQSRAGILDTNQGEQASSSSSMVRRSLMEPSQNTSREMKADLDDIPVSVSSKSSKKKKKRKDAKESRRTSLLDTKSESVAVPMQSTEEESRDLGLDDRNQAQSAHASQPFAEPPSGTVAEESRREIAGEPDVGAEDSQLESAHDPFATAVAADEVEDPSTFEWRPSKQSKKDKKKAKKARKSGDDSFSNAGPLVGGALAAGALAATLSGGTQSQKGDTESGQVATHDEFSRKSGKKPSVEVRKNQQLVPETEVDASSDLSATAARETSEADVPAPADEAVDNAAVAIPHKPAQDRSARSRDEASTATDPEQSEPITSILPEDVQDAIQEDSTAGPDPWVSTSKKSKKKNKKQRKASVKFADLPSEDDPSREAAQEAKPMSNWQRAPPIRADESEAMEADKREAAKSGETKLSKAEEPGVPSPATVSLTDEDERASTVIPTPSSAEDSHVRTYALPEETSESRDIEGPTPAHPRGLLQLRNSVDYSSPVASGGRQGSLPKEDLNREPTWEQATPVHPAGILRMRNSVDDSERTRVPELSDPLFELGQREETTPKEATPAHPVGLLQLRNSVDDSGPERQSPRENFRSPLERSAEEVTPAHPAGLLRLRNSQGESTPERRIQSQEFQFPQERTPKESTPAHPIGLLQLRNSDDFSASPTEQARGDPSQAASISEPTSSDADQENAIPDKKAAPTTGFSTKMPGGWDEHESESVTVDDAADLKNERNDHPNDSDHLDEDLGRSELDRLEPSEELGFKAGSVKSRLAEAVDVPLPASGPTSDAEDYDSPAARFEGSDTGADHRTTVSYKDQSPGDVDTDHKDQSREQAELPSPGSKSFNPLSIFQRTASSSDDASPSHPVGLLSMPNASETRSAHKPTENVALPQTSTGKAPAPTDMRKTSFDDVVLASIAASGFNSDVAATDEPATTSKAVGSRSPSPSSAWHRSSPKSSPKNSPVLKTSDRKASPSGDHKMAFDDVVAATLMASGFGAEQLRGKPAKEAQEAEPRDSNGASQMAKQSRSGSPSQMWQKDKRASQDLESEANGASQSNEVGADEWGMPATGKKKNKGKKGRKSKGIPLSVDLPNTIAESSDYEPKTSSQPLESDDTQADIKGSQDLRSEPLQQEPQQELPHGDQSGSSRDDLNVKSSPPIEDRSVEQALIEDDSAPADAPTPADEQARNVAEPDDDWSQPASNSKKSKKQKRKSLKKGLSLTEPTTSVDALQRIDNEPTPEEFQSTSVEDSSFGRAGLDKDSRQLSDKLPEEGRSSMPSRDGDAPMSNPAAEDERIPEREDVEPMWSKPLTAKEKKKQKRASAKAEKVNKNSSVEKTPKDDTDTPSQETLPVETEDAAETEVPRSILANETSVPKLRAVEEGSFPPTNSGGASDGEQGAPLLKDGPEPDAEDEWAIPLGKKGKKNKRSSKIHPGKNDYESNETSTPFEPTDAAESTITPASRETKAESQFRETSASKGLGESETNDSVVPQSSAFASLEQGEQIVEEPMEIEPPSVPGQRLNEAEQGAADDWAAPLSSKEKKKRKKAQKRASTNQSQTRNLTTVSLPRGHDIDEDGAAGRGFDEAEPSNLGTIGDKLDQPSLGDAELGEASGSTAVMDPMEVDEQDSAALHPRQTDHEKTTSLSKSESTAQDIDANSSVVKETTEMTGNAVATNLDKAESKDLDMDWVATDSQAEAQQARAVDDAERATVNTLEAEASNLDALDEPAPAIEEEAWSAPLSSKEKKKRKKAEAAAAKGSKRSEMERSTMADVVMAAAAGTAASVTAKAQSETPAATDEAEQESAQNGENEKKSGSAAMSATDADFQPQRKLSKKDKKKKKKNQTGFVAWEDFTEGGASEPKKDSREEATSGPTDADAKEVQAATSVSEHAAASGYEATSGSAARSGARGLTRANTSQLDEMERGTAHFEEVSASAKDEQDQDFAQTTGAAPRVEDIDTEAREIGRGQSDDTPPSEPSSIFGPTGQRDKEQYQERPDLEKRSSGRPPAASKSAAAADTDSQVSSERGRQLAAIPEVSREPSPGLMEDLSREEEGLAGRVTGPGPGRGGLTQSALGALDDERGGDWHERSLHPDDSRSEVGSRVASREAGQEGVAAAASGRASEVTANIRRAYIRSPGQEQRDAIIRPKSAQSTHSRAGSAASAGSSVLRRVDRSVSSDLRAASKRDAALATSGKAASPQQQQEPVAAAHQPPELPANYEPLRGPGKDRRQDMSDGGVFEAWGDARGSPRSPTKPPSMRKRQSMQIIELEAQIDEMRAENRALHEASSRSRSRQEYGSPEPTTPDVLQRTIQSRDIALRDKDAEIDNIKSSLSTLRDEISRLTEHNEQLQSANNNLTADVNGRYAALQAERDEAQTQWQQSSRQLDELHARHEHLSGGMEAIVQEQINAALDEKNAEIESLRAELDEATERIADLQRQIQDAGDDFLKTRDVDYFDTACQQLCQHVQQWVLRFSKFSDTKMCRLSAQINDEATETRLDNAVLDGSDVDTYLSDRVRRRDVFMSIVMTMIWEFIFTRYLFGMDRDQRQKLKALEKTLSEVGPQRAVAQWRATTLTLLSRRDAFQEQRAQDTEAVCQEIYGTLERLLPPPRHLVKQVQESLRNVLSLAVDVSIEMRTQRPEYVMLPPLQPEYDTNGDLARKVYFNAALMNERSGETASNEELEEQSAVLRVVLFPLVVKKGNDQGETDDEVVVCPAQVLVARPESDKLRALRMSNKSTQSVAPSILEPGSMA